LYHQRWPVEEDYKELKLRVVVENWSGKSALSINQDFYAKVLTANLSAILAQPAQQEVARQSQSKQYAYQVNFTHLLSKMKDSVVYLLRGLAVRDILDGLWQIMVRTVEPIRPGRRYPRSKARMLKRFSMTYKPVR
ncbi:MAG: IS4/IS5 family transposase, partial [Anaerolineae bacterium]